DRSHRLSFIFFFRAEDGIRDRNVTGVQTCALPIFELGKELAPYPEALHTEEHLVRGCQSQVWLHIQVDEHTGKLTLLLDSDALRSEERRVGKECRCRRRPDNSEKNIQASARDRVDK